MYLVILIKFVITVTLSPRQTVIAIHSYSRQDITGCQDVGCVRASVAQVSNKLTFINNQLMQT